MEAIISNLVSRFEKGLLSRRELVRGLAALAAGGTAASAQEGLNFSAATIDHVSIQVADLKRSIDFYQKMFGFKEVSGEPARNILRLGNTRTLVSLNQQKPAARWTISRLESRVTTRKRLCAISRSVASSRWRATSQASMCSILTESGCRSARRAERAAVDDAIRRVGRHEVQTNRSPIDPPFPLPAIVVRSASRRRRVTKLRTALDPF
jgi:hypothetical protein